MSRTIKRGPPPRRTVSRKRQQKVSLGDRILAKLPVSEATLRTAATWAFLAAGGAAAIVAASWFGIPGTVGAAIAESAGRAGLRVEQVDITGLKRMNRETVYAVALEDQPSAMLRVDLAAIRQRLLAYGWVQDAYVSRRLPDRLLIHVVEREPAAIWQNDGQLTLIDAQGVLLEPVSRENMPDLPLVIGAGADRQEAGYNQLLDAAPALKPKVRAASWVGNRRWDLTFDSGETLKLPEDGAAQALIEFAKRDGATPLLGKGWVSFDMRDPDKLVARKPGGDMEHALPDDGKGAAIGETRVARAGDV